MFIPVVLKDGHEELVSTSELQRLLSQKQILIFKRSDGWVFIGRSKMRNLQVPYNGMDRRQQHLFQLACDGQEAFSIIGLQGQQ